MDGWKGIGWIEVTLSTKSDQIPLLSHSTPRQLIRMDGK